jgi:hypothetical protein
VGLTKGIRKGEREQNLGSWIPRSMSLCPKPKPRKEEREKVKHPAQNDKSCPYM